jgi:hypothetical protein
MTNTAENTTEVIPIKEKEMSTELAAPTQQIGDIMLNPDLLSQAMVMAESMATSKVTVPDHLKGNVGDCYAIVLQSLQWRMNPFVVAQKTHLVSGKLGYEAQLVNALVQASGHIQNTFKYEYRGEGANLECRVGATLKGDAEITWGEWLSFGSVTTKNSPLWKTNPRQQMGYLQVKNWTRLYLPAAILGVYSDDELMDAPAPAEPKDITPARPELSLYADEKFEENLPKWKDLIDGGKRTAEQVIAMVSSKATLSEEQVNAIKELENDNGNA